MPIWNAVFISERNLFFNFLRSFPEPVHTQQPAARHSEVGRVSSQGGHWPSSTVRCICAQDCAKQALKLLLFDEYAHDTACCNRSKSGTPSTWSIAPFGLGTARSGIPAKKGWRPTMAFTSCCPGPPSKALIAACRSARRCRSWALSTRIAERARDKHSPKSNPVFKASLPIASDRSSLPQPLANAHKAALSCFMRVCLTLRLFGPKVDPPGRGGACWPARRAAAPIPCKRSMSTPPVAFATPYPRPKLFKHGEPRLPKDCKRT